MKYAPIISAVIGFVIPRARAVTSEESGAPSLPRLEPIWASPPGGPSWGSFLSSGALVGSTPLVLGFPAWCPSLFVVCMDSVNRFNGIYRGSELCWAGNPQLTSPLKTRIVCGGRRTNYQVTTVPSTECWGPEKDIRVLWEAGMVLNRFCVSLFSSVSRVYPTSLFAQLGTLYEFLHGNAFI